jgi:hypothetical protein
MEVGTALSGDYIRIVPSRAAKEGSARSAARSRADLQRAGST